MPDPAARPLRPLLAGVLCALAVAGPARAQSTDAPSRPPAVATRAAELHGPARLDGTVLDARHGGAVVDATLTLRALDPAAAAAPARTATTRADGAYVFADLPRGAYELAVERFGYRGVTLDVALERDAPLSDLDHARADPVPARCNRP